MGEEFLSSFWTHTWNAIKNRGNPYTRTALAVAFIGEAVRFITHALHKV